MQQTLSREQAIGRMNEWGANGVPFLFLIDFELQRPVVLRLSELSPEQLMYNINGQTNTTQLPPRGPVYLERYPMPLHDYAEAFRRVQAGIRAGNSYLLNLAFPTPIATNLSLREIFLRSRARYRIWLRGSFTCFSPEIFVTISPQGRIASFPMKGTIDASLPAAREQLLANEKERAEHATIVDLIRNDLSQVAQGVEVARYRYLETIPTHQGQLLQSSSEVSGQLPPHWERQIGDLLFQLLPAGSISGAPKRKTVEIIQAAEGRKRGYYTGVCGLFNGRRIDSGVMIRFIEQQPNGLVFKSGGGITARSRTEEEYEEMIRKAYLPFATEAVPYL